MARKLTEKTRQSAGKSRNAKKRQKVSDFYGDPDSIALGLLGDDFVFVEKEGTPKGSSYTLRWWRDDFYRWVDGRWMRISDAEMKRFVAEHIQSLNDRTFDDKEQQITVTTYRVNNVLLCLQGRIGISETTELNSWPDGREKLLYTISVNNGLLMLNRYGTPGKKTGKPVLTKHTPHYFSLTKLPYDYDPKAECPLWLDFVNDVMQGNKDLVFLLQQWCGYLFRPDLKEQKFLLCVGEGANGKGVLFEVVQSLVGKDNCSQVGLARFANPFALHGMNGKVLNATNESSHIIESEAETILKSLVAGDKITVERKFKEPILNSIPTAKIMIATNALPRFSDKTEGIWRRILLVPFDKVIPEKQQVKNLADQLKHELSGILNWALEGLQKLNQSGGFTVPELSKDLLEEHRRDADPARAFLIENYSYSADAQGISCKQCYRDYKQWCVDNGCKQMNSKTFGRHVRRVFPNVQRIRAGGRESREWIYAGLVSQENGSRIDQIPI